MERFPVGTKLSVQLDTRGDRWLARLARSVRQRSGADLAPDMLSPVIAPRASRESCIPSRSNKPFLFSAIAQFDACCVLKSKVKTYDEHGFKDYLSLSPLGHHLSG